MQLSSKQKMYAGVLGLCGIALTVDRVILGPDELTAAEAIEDYAVSATPSSESSVQSAQGADPGTLWAIARKVDAVAEAENVDFSTISDVFKAPESWFPPPTVEVAPTPEGPDPVEAFLAAHRLQAVMAGNSGGVAVVDGEGLLVGKTLDGFTLVSVGDRSAVFESENGVRVELELVDDDG